MLLLNSGRKHIAVSVNKELVNKSISKMHFTGINFLEHLLLTANKST